MNLGDVAMMHALVERIAAMFSDSDIMLVTNNPAAAARHLPRVTPIDPQALEPCHRPPGRLARLRGYAGALAGKSRRASTDIPLIDSVDAMVLSGCGFINDHFPNAAAMRLRRLQYAGKRGKAVALFGQGLGPANAPALLHVMAETLPAADIIGVRERLETPRILREAGVAADKIVVTGDDAAEYAFNRYTRRPDTEHIGVGIRAAPYSGAGAAEEGVLAGAIARVLTEHGARAMPIPIAFPPAFPDHVALQRVLKCDVPDFEHVTLDRLVDAAGGCRVVISGTYHAAVFALAQGVPVIGIYANDYYRTKMSGLFDMYGWPEENLLSLLHDDFPAMLATRVRDLAGHDGCFTTSLRHAARRQIHASRQAYNRLAYMLGGVPLAAFDKDA